MGIAEDNKTIDTIDKDPAGESSSRKIRVYLDNCTYNRPYDDQLQTKIELETRAKL